MKGVQRGRLSRDLSQLSEQCQTCRSTIRQVSEDPRQAGTDQVENIEGEKVLQCDRTVDKTNRRITSSDGDRYPNALWGLSVLYSICQAVIFSRASSSDMNQC